MIKLLARCLPIYLLILALLCACMVAEPPVASTSEATSVPISSASVPPASSTTQGHPFPATAILTTPPPYTRPAALPGPALIPLDCRFQDSETGDSAGLPMARDILYLPFDDDEELSIPSPAVTTTLDGGIFVAGADFAATAWSDDALYFGISRNNGEDWTVSRVDDIPFDKSSLTLRFASEALGWLTVQKLESSQALLYKTTDGGGSWQQSAYFDNAAWIDCYFATEDTGWLVGIRESDADTAKLYETMDGGKSWYPVRLSGVTGGEPFMPESLPAYSPLIGWVLEQQADYTQPLLFYRAVGEAAMWEPAPAEELFVLPDGISYAQLIAGTSFYLPYSGYRQGQGLPPEEISGFWMACRTEQYIRENYGDAAVASSGDDYSWLITAAQINEYVLYQYGDPNFDATRLDGYDPALGGMKHGDGHGGLGKNMNLRQVRSLEDGSIELLYDVVPMALGGQYYYCTGIYRVRVQPGSMPGGGIIFTLVESGALTPLPKAQGLHYSV